MKKGLLLAVLATWNQVRSKLSIDHQKVDICTTTELLSQMVLLRQDLIVGPIVSNYAKI